MTSHMMVPLFLSKVILITHLKDLYDKIGGSMILDTSTLVVCLVCFHSLFVKVKFGFGIGIVYSFS